MVEYELTLESVRDGVLTLDVRVPGSSGTSQILQFESPWELQDFLAHTGLSSDKVQEIQTICQTLQNGAAFHAQMFLPTFVEDRIKEHVRRPAA